MKHPSRVKRFCSGLGTTPLPCVPCASTRRKSRYGLADFSRHGASEQWSYMFGKLRGRAILGDIIECLGGVERDY